MLDLNIGAGFSVDADSVTSTTNNAAFAAADELNSTSSTYKDSIPTLNFAILPGNAIEIEDNMNNNGVASNINELQLFPAADRAKHSLNSSAAEVSRSGGVELGIFKAQMPYNNGVQVQQPQTNRCRRGPRSRSSQYRGITFYRRTRRWESHIWDGHRQIYLGGFDTAHAAARAYDRAAIKFRGVHADINFSISDYEEDMKQMKNLTNKEFVQTLRCKSDGFSRGSSKYRGLTLQRMGQFFHEKPYHDKATIAYNQRETPTNFKLSNYKRERSSTLTDGGSGRNLDLNLGISLASDGPWRNYTTSNLHFPCTCSGSPYGKGVKQKSKAMSGEAISVPGISNWESNVQSNVMVNRLPVLYSAPSSGFSFTTTLHSTPSSRPIAIRGTYI